MLAEFPNGAVSPDEVGRCLRSLPKSTLGTDLYVHCQCGHDRSTVTVQAFLGSTFISLLSPVLAVECLDASFPLFNSCPCGGV